MFSSCSWVSGGVQCHHHVRPLLPGEDHRRYLHRPLCRLQLQPDPPLPGARRRVPVWRRGQCRPCLPHADVRCRDPAPGRPGWGGSPGLPVLWPRGQGQPQPGDHGGQGTLLTPPRPALELSGLGVSRRLGGGAQSRSCPRRAALPVAG